MLLLLAALAWADEDVDPSRILTPDLTAGMDAARLAPARGLVRGEHGALVLTEVDLSDFDLPITANDEVERWIRFFLGPGRKSFESWRSRWDAHAPLLTRELDAAGLPTDLVYLSMIESGFRTDAVSTSGAVGLWQFLPGTGTDYGLVVGPERDERTDPLRSTRAATRFLSELHGRYGDWYLAMAAYNGGPGYLDATIREAGTDDYWALSRGWLRQETADYVPKILAAAILHRYAEHFGLAPAAGS